MNTDGKQDARRGRVTSDLSHGEAGNRLEVANVLGCHAEAQLQGGRSNQ